VVLVNALQRNMRQGHFDIPFMVDGRRYSDPSSSGEGGVTLLSPAVRGHGSRSRSRERGAENREVVPRTKRGWLRGWRGRYFRGSLLC